MKYRVLPFVMLLGVTSFFAKCFGQTTVNILEEHANTGMTNKKFFQCYMMRVTDKIEAAEARMNDLENQLNGEKAKREALESQLKEEETKREALESIINEEKIKREAIESQVTALQQQASTLADKVSKVGQQVGFSAYINSGRVHPALGEAIPFHGVHINQGGHYSASTSVYTCPITGTYYFIFSISSTGIKDGTQSIGVLVQDEQELAVAFSRTANPNHVMFLQCSQGMITHCNQGSKVWVKSTVNNNQAYGIESNRDSTFSGFLLYAD